MEMQGRRRSTARSVAAAAALSLLGFAVCCGVIRSMTGLPVSLDSLDENEEKVSMSEISSRLLLAK